MLLTAGPSLQDQYGSFKINRMGRYRWLIHSITYLVWCLDDSNVATKCLKLHFDMPLVISAIPSSTLRLPLSEESFLRVVSATGKSEAAPHLVLVPGNLVWRQITLLCRVTGTVLMGARSTPEYRCLKLGSLLGFCCLTFAFLTPSSALPGNVLTVLHPNPTLMLEQQQSKCSFSASSWSKLYLLSIRLRVSFLVPLWHLGLRSSAEMELSFINNTS